MALFTCQPWVKSRGREVIHGKSVHEDGAIPVPLSTGLDLRAGAS